MSNELKDSLDAKFVSRCAVTLFLNPDIIDQAIKDLRGGGYLVKEVDCREESFLPDLAKALHWEEQFGYVPTHLNLDALNDALCGFPGRDETQVALVFRNYQMLQKRDAFRAHGMLDIIECHSRDCLLCGRRLITFVHTDDPRTDIRDLGARDANWNRDEWSHASRGL